MPSTVLANLCLSLSLAKTPYSSLLRIQRHFQQGNRLHSYYCCPRFRNNYTMEPQYPFLGLHFDVQLVLLLQRHFNDTDSKVFHPHCMNAGVSNQPTRLSQLTFLKTIRCLKHPFLLRIARLSESLVIWIPTASNNYN